MENVTLESRPAQDEAMSLVLDLQRLDVPEDIDFFGNSGTSSPGGCCNC